MSLQSSGSQCMFEAPCQKEADCTCSYAMMTLTCSKYKPQKCVEKYPGIAGTVVTFGELSPINTVTPSPVTKSQVINGRSHD
jgi:hypothetical protein